jgi:hypothetical protein
MVVLTESAIALVDRLWQDRSLGPIVLKQLAFENGSPKFDLQSTDHPNCLCGDNYSG